MDARERFTFVMGQAPEAISLDEAALLVAAEEYPSLEIAGYQARLDAMAKAVGPRLRWELEPARLAGALNDYLFDHLGFRGNTADYYDPRNSFLNEVLDRRVGIPITLAIMYISVGMRVGLPLAGVAFPGHFVVIYRANPDPLFLDPFNQGRLLSENDFRLLYLERRGPDARFDPALLRPAGPHEVIARLLRNLKYVYAAREEFARAARCSERILQITGQVEERRDLGILLARDGRLHEATAQLQRYLAEAPEAADRAQVEAQVWRLWQQMRRLS